MFVFVGDETNVTQSKESRFFIYGGLIIDVDKCAEACSKVETIRKKYHFLPIHELKFDSRSRPPSLLPADFSVAKNEVLDAAREANVRFMAYAVCHDIAANQKINTSLWALKTLLCQFDLFLNREKSHGICLVDRFENDFNVIRGIHQNGVDPDVGGGKMPHLLKNIWGYGTVSSGTSHITSLVDIILGAFRYCVNDTTRSEISNLLYGKVRPMMLSEDNNPEKIEEWGLFLRPKEIKSALYQKQYTELLARFKS